MKISKLCGYRHKSLSASLAFLPCGTGSRSTTNAPSHKSLSASLAFLPSKRNPFRELHIRVVTKAFRLHWHFCPRSFVVVSPRKGRVSQKPFGFIGISASRNGCPVQREYRHVTKAFRLHWHFCPQVRGKFAQSVDARHKSLSASLAFLPRKGLHMWCADFVGHKSLSASLAFLPMAYNIASLSTLYKCSSA